MNELTVILPAAGSSVRFGSDKLAQMLGDVPVIVQTLRAFLQQGSVTRIVIPSRDPQAMSQFVRKFIPDLRDKARLQFRQGGASRAESVLNGLKPLPPNVEWVAVHDAARPIVSQDLITRTWKAAMQYGAAVPATSMQATIKQATGPLPAKIEKTLPRETLWAMQTPQIMRRQVLLEAYEKCTIPLNQITDDVQLLEQAGHPVWLVEGEHTNIKITTPVDFHLANLIVQSA